MSRDTKRLEKLGNEFFGHERYLTNILYYDYRGRDHALGEIDLYGFVDDTLYLVEHKCRDTFHNRKKSKNQLLRMEEYATIFDVPYVLVYAYYDGKGGCNMEILKECNGKSITYDEM